MKYLQLKYQDSFFNAKINSTGLSIVFVARAIVDKDDERVEILLNGFDFKGKTEKKWIRINDLVMPGTLELSTKSLSENLENECPEEVVKLLTSENPLDKSTRKFYKGFRINFRDKEFKAILKSKYYQIVFLISIKVMDSDEQFYISLNGKDLESGKSIVWINQSFEVNEKFKLKLL